MLAIAKPKANWPNNNWRNTGRFIFSIIFAKRFFLTRTDLCSTGSDSRSTKYANIKLANEISMGNHQAEEFVDGGKDEIGVLAKSFNRMRRSLSSAMTMLEQSIPRQ